MIGQNSWLSFIKKNRYIFALILIAILSFWLNFSGIEKYDFGNGYYAAAIRSMSMNFKNFFYVSFDPSGMVSVDKPPLGLWVQTIFVWIFGYHGWAMLLPQALAGTASCIMLYVLIAKYFGRPAGLLASLLCALTPVVVVASRNNTMDTQLVFVLLLATWLFLRSIEKRKWRYLFVAAVLVGLGFNIKMLEAYLILPSMALVYLFFAKEKLHKRFIAGIISIIIVLLVSSAWVLAVDLTPADSRPYVDSSTNNTVSELIIGHNGLERLNGHYTEESDGTGTQSEFIGVEISAPSLTRLWYGNNYGQVGWLVTFALFSLAAVVKPSVFRRRTLKNAALSYWMIWFFSMGLFFSFAGFFHRYYMCILAPSIAALCAISIVKMYGEFKKKRSWRQFLLPAAFATTLGFQLSYVWNYEGLRPWLFVIMAVFGAAALALIIATYFKPSQLIIWCSAAALLISLLSAPLYWSYTLVMYKPNCTIPAAGPENADLVVSDTQEIQFYELEKYLVQHYKPGSFLVVTQISNDIANYIVDTGLPAYAYGGYLGTVNSLNVEKLKTLVAEGKITYFMATQNNDNSAQIIDYVKTHATLIQPSEYSGISNLGSGYALYHFDS